MSQSGPQMTMFAERWVAALIDVVFEGLLVHDGEAITDANERVARMFGFDHPSELVGLPWYALLAPAGRRASDERVRKGVEGRYRTVCRHRDGSTFSLDVHARETHYEGRRARIVAFRYPGDGPPGSDPLIQKAAALDRTVQALAETIEQRDSFTAGHQDRVSRLAVQVADRLGVGASTLATIRMAAHVHDIGKIAIPAEILMKPTTLTSEEFALIKGHVAAGHRILQGIAFDGPVAEAVLQHHERLDGKGYPAGLDDPICEARVLMAVDVYDALNSARPYRAGVPPGRTIEMMQDGEAGLLDAEVVRHLAAVVL